MTDKEKKNKVGFGVNDCPIGVYKRFKEGCVERCGDVHWVRVKELLDAEEAYLTLSKAVYGIENEEQQVVYEEPAVVEDKEVEHKPPKYLGRKE